MTIAIAIKVGDGIVFAADSATTLASVDSNGDPVIHMVYNNANKIVNLHKRVPVGVMTWGAGSIDQTSMSSLFKDFRKDWTDRDAEPAEWSIRDVADELAEFLYTKVAGGKSIGGGGQLVAGWDPDAQTACAFGLDNESHQVVEVLKSDSEAIWFGQSDVLSRVLNGFSYQITDVLKDNFGVSDADLPKALDVLRSKLAFPVMAASMPIQDALDLAQFLADTTKQSIRFQLGAAATVGGPIELAAITKHEGFKWATRKYYYDSNLNPG